MSGKTTDQTKRKWLIFLIFAPGVFFIVYWLATQTSDRVTGHTVELPDQYVSLGEQVEVKGKYYQVRGGKNIFINTVDLSNNRAVAEPGRVFVGLVLVTDAKINQNDVQLIDALGRSYNPLDVDKSVVVSNFKLPGNEGYPYMFKVNDSPDYYFIQVNGDERLTWLINNTYQR
ncbi:hypothetical protein [Desulfallas thermosapovorans]|uniref:DUF4352 domain-containing protein n=1 Tax=Desulfallas thermosapovorans DSM 6562 TaxID=1121431 RepID=A0A5S4ZQS8_9FIRM|nr:hypothetical protein [Desulfallas thermosapovorans]TYO94960.1 hypothetical protein LX24_01976 [Desulfallas thermosapovorans DSM 6562]